jgi:hypothetical protein
MKRSRLLSYEWDGIAGILAAVEAIVLHLLHVIDEQIILPVSQRKTAWNDDNLMKCCAAAQHFIVSGRK